MKIESLIRAVVLFVLLACFDSPLSAQTKLSWSGVDLTGKQQVIEQGAASFGPYDYTNPQHVRDNLAIVENHHFTTEVEQLISGKSASIYADLVYTIKAFPNHHRALYSLVQYQLISSRKISIPPECWLDRGIVFAPTDKVLYSIYGIYLYKLGKYDLAVEKYLSAEQLPGDNVEVHYNLGLLYVKLDELPKAVEYAEKAYASGYPLGGLRKQLGDRGYTLSE